MEPVWTLRAGVELLQSRAANLVLFNAMWVGCVLGRDQWIVVVAPLVFAYAGLLILSGTVRAWQILLPVAIGLSLDSLMTAAGLFVFNEAALFLPLWLPVLWIAFSTTLTRSLAVFGRNKAVAALCGALAFPFNYSVGERLGAVQFHEDYFLTVVALAVTWALALPLLYFLVEDRSDPANALA